METTMLWLLTAAVAADVVHLYLVRRRVDRMERIVNRMVENAVTYEIVLKDPEDK